MIKGIDQNTNPESTSSNYIYWGKNGVSNRKLDASINERGTKEIIDLSTLDILFKNGVTTLGFYIILFYKNNSNQDCIALINEFTNTIQVKVQRTDFNFNINYPIKARAKFNPRNEVVVAFVDGYNSSKYVNLDTATITDSLNFYNLFPITFSADDIQTDVLDSGSLLTGTYIGSFQYISRDRTRSQFTTLSNPVYITPIDPTQSSIVTKGTKAGVGSNKAIKFTFTNIDTSYSKIALAVISKINGVVTQKLVKEVSITSSTLSVVYGGTEFLSDITLEELITDNVRYLTANHIATLNDQLFLADLTAAPVVDYQAIVNLTSLYWNSTYDSTFTLVNASKHKAGNLKTCIHDEVYAFYMQLELLDGSFTDWYHIPGRPLQAGDRADSSIYNAGLTIDGGNPKVFQVQDTCTYLGANVDATRFGALGVWENEDEIYPANFPTFAGQKVRHHKFPSVQYMAENVWNDQDGYGINNLDRLGIKIINTSIDYSVIKGYRVGYAKRSLSDVGVLGMGLTMFAGAPEISGGVFDNNVLTSSGGNFRVDSQNGADDNLAPNTGYIRFNSFDIWQDRPDVTSAYLRNYVKLKAQNLATGINISPTYGTIAAGSFVSTPQVDLTSYACNFTNQNAAKVIRAAVDAGNQIRKLSSQTYVPNNVKYAQNSIIVDNRGLEETLLAKVEGTVLGLTTYGNIKVHSGNFIAEDPTLAEETYLSALKTPKADYFLSFDNQTIVVNPTIFRGTTTNYLNNIGDGFVGVHSYISLAPYNKNAQTSLTESIANFKIHVGVSRHNVNLRYQIIGDYSTYLFSDSGTFSLGGNYSQYWFWLNPKTSQWNNFQYSKDFSMVNDLEVFGIFNRDIINQNTYNYRIPRSTKASTENALEDGWKTFKPLDYFDTVRNKGPIMNLEEWGDDALLIHHKYALFKTRDKAVLQTNVIAITLGSGEIFAIEPKEINPTRTGTGGTQHKYSCLLTDVGYFFVDQEVNNVYLYDGNELKDAGKGLNNFFWNNFGCNQDNPFNFDGITLAYDQFNYRLLLSQKAVGGNNFTVSLDLAKMEWAFAHDYIPDYMFNTRTNFYSFKLNKLYTHNEGDVGNYYGTIYPFYVDFIVNDEPNIQKLLAELKWLSKVKALDGSVQQRKTITSITVWNDQHCSDKIDIVTNESDSLFVDANAKIVDETWSFDDLADHVIDPAQPFISSLLTDSRPIPANIQKPVWYDSEPLRGKFFIVRLEYDNIENKEVHLRELIPTLRKSA